MLNIQLIQTLNNYVVIQPLGFVMEWKKKRKRSLSRKKGSKAAEAPVVTVTVSTDAQNSVKDDN